MAMVLLLDWERITMERARAPGINRRSRSRHCFRESAGRGPGSITWDFGLDDHPALLTNRVSAVAGIAALLNGVTSKGPLNRAHT
jgi:hypothetical protein